MLRTQRKPFRGPNGAARVQEGDGGEQEGGGGEWPAA
jgi:hypothetical protein